MTDASGAAPSRLAGRLIGVGVTGSIAAYKAAELSVACATRAPTSSS